MNAHLRARVAAVRESLTARWRGLKVHRYWVQLGAITLLAVLTLLIVGRSSHARADSYSAEAQRLGLIGLELDRWAGTIEWPTAEETQTWRESESLFNRLGGASVAPLSLANQLVQRGEEVSRGDVRIRLA